MSDTADNSLLTAAGEKPPFYRNTTVVKWIAQVLALAVVLFAIFFMVGQAGDNLEAKDVNTGFDFLNTDPDFKLGDGIDTEPKTGGRALWVGMVNTIRLSAAGILIATVLGVLIGIFRLSNNWIVAKVASAFIEYMRNIPLLVHIFLIFFILAKLSNFGENVKLPIDPETGEEVTGLRLADGAIVSDAGFVVDPEDLLEQANIEGLEVVDDIIVNAAGEAVDPATLVDGVSLMDDVLFIRETSEVIERSSLIDGDLINVQAGEIVSQGPINGWLHVSNKGLSVPRVHIADGFYQWAIFLLIGAIIGRWLMRKRKATRDETGHETYPVLSFAGVVAFFGLIGWFLHPIFGWVGDTIFAPLARAIDGVPQSAVQIGLSLIAVAAAVLWIKRFLDSRRTPAGLAKLTDDDWFRMIFAGVSAALAALIFMVIWPGGSSWLINSSRDLMEVAADKFGDGRGDWRTDWPIDAARPDIDKVGRFANMGPSGLNFVQGFAALFFGVVLYTSAFIAEIVRGGILAVPKGQTEAAKAIGLRRSTMLRHIILPQAFRVSLPPLGNQYLNLTKNTSLGIAVGYSEVVQVGQTIFNQSGRTLEVFIIWMLFYLACSLTISVVVNFFNVRTKIIER